MIETYGISFCHDGFWDSCRVCPESKLVNIKFGIFYVLIFKTLQLENFEIFTSSLFIGINVSISIKIPYSRAEFHDIKNIVLIIC